MAIRLFPDAEQGTGDSFVQQQGQQRDGNTLDQIQRRDLCSNRCCDAAQLLLCLIEKGDSQ